MGDQQESRGINLHGRRMWYEPWPVNGEGQYREPSDEEQSERFSSSGEAVAKTFLYFEECTEREIEGSDPQLITDKLINMLNAHVPDKRFHTTRDTLLDSSRWYTSEYYFYFIMFTKQVLGRYDFHFGEDSDQPLSKHHRIYEKGYMDAVPWMTGEELSAGHDYSIVNNSGPLHYLEQQYTSDSSDFISWINSSIPGQVSIDRSFYHSETYWVSAEMIQYGYEFLKILSNNSRFCYHAGYTTTLSKASTSRVLLNAPRSLVVFAFKKLVSKTNNVFDYSFITFKDGNFRFSARMKDSFNRTQYGKHMGACLINHLDTNLGAFLGAVELIYRPSTRLQENWNLSVHDPVEFTISYRWPTRQIKVLGYAFLTGFVTIASMMTVLYGFLGTSLPGAAVFSLLMGVLSAMFLVQYLRKRELAARLEENLFLFTEQLETLEKTSSDLLQERNLLEQKVDERTSDLARANEQLRQLDAAKTSFFMNISHELRTPLTLMLAPLEAIRLGKYGTNIKHDHTVFHSMERNGKRLLKLISNILDFAKIESGRMEMHSRAVDVNQLVSHCIASVQSAADHKGIQLTWSSWPEELVSMMDPELMENVMFNLLSNAIKFNQERVGSVDIQVKVVGNSISVSVEDTGIGIDPEYHEAVFDRFSQIDSTSTRKYEGTGIGLALTKEIVEMHNGAITMKSEPGKGSRFTVILPLHVPGVLPPEGVYPMARGEENISEQQVVEALHSQEVEKQGTVLVVEDNYDMRNLLAFLLEEDYDVLLARDGNEGLEILEKEREAIDLVLTDIMMPHKDGFELVREIRANPLNQYLPVVLLTARADVQDTVYGITSGANDYISKPFNRSELLARIGSHLKLKKLHDSIDNVKQEESQQISDVMQEKIELVCAFIRDNYRDDLSREGLASAVEMSPDHLSRTFKRLKGKRINDVINEFRINEAVSLLDNSDMNIVEVAMTVGFESLRTFNRIFTQLKGQSPTGWRKRGEELPVR